MHQLLEKVFLSAFGNDSLNSRHDPAALNLADKRLAFTTDSYVVRSIFFPGGDIGSFAVHGTVNDLAMSGARPLFLSAGFILKEGLPMETLWRVVCSANSWFDPNGNSCSGEGSLGRLTAGKHAAVPGRGSVSAQLVIRSSGNEFADEVGHTRRAAAD